MQIKYLSIMLSQFLPSKVGEYTSRGTFLRGVPNTMHTNENLV